MISIGAVLTASSFLLGMAIGGGFAYKLEHAKVIELKFAISEANQKSQEKLNETIAKNKAIEDEQKRIIIEIDKQHTESLAAVSALATKLSIARVRYNKYKAGHSCAVSKTGDTSVSEDPAGTVDLPERLDKLIDRNAAIADRNSEYASRAYEWAKSIK